MSKLTYNFDSLNRHNISIADIDEVLGTGIWEELTPSKRGYERLMFIGFTSEGRLLEVGIEYFDDNNIEHVFHADDASRRYRIIFENRTNR